MLEGALKIALNLVLACACHVLARCHLASTWSFCQCRPESTPKPKPVRGKVGGLTRLLWASHVADETVGSICRLVVLQSCGIRAVFACSRHEPHAGCSQMEAGHEMPVAECACVSFGCTGVSGDLGAENGDGREPLLPQPSTSALHFFSSCISSAKGDPPRHHDGRRLCKNVAFLHQFIDLTSRGGRRQARLP